MQAVFYMSEWQVQNGNGATSRSSLKLCYPDWSPCKTPLPQLIQAVFENSSTNTEWPVSMLPLISQAANKLECRTGPKSCMFGLWKLGHAIYADYERVHLFDLVFDMHKQII